jgi:hypothetical protein
MPVAFPGTPELSLFLPPGENPLSEEGNWAQTTPARHPMQKIDTGGGHGAATDSVHGDPNFSHWARDVFRTEDGIVEVWGCIAGGQLGAALETWRVALWHVLGDRIRGYLFYIGGALSKDYVIRRYDGGITNFTSIAGVGGGYPQKMGLRIDGDQVEAWIEDSVLGWVLATSATDTTYRGTFWAGIGVEDPTGGGLSFPCFGAGVPNRPQFFRWTRGYREPGED